MTTSNRAVRPPQLPQAGSLLPPRADVPRRQPVVPIEWFRRMPNGGTVFLKPSEAVQNE